VSESVAENHIKAETAEQFIARKREQWEREHDRVIWTKDIGREGWHGWVREAGTLHAQHNLREKVLVIERWRHHGFKGVRAYTGGAQPGDIEYRFGYFTVGRIGRAGGRWVWGQFSVLIPRADLSQLLRKARDEGTLLDDP
jgi:hypothetical protein